VKKITGNCVSVSTAATKHGISLERKAKQQYQAQQNKKLHKAGLKTRDSGLIVSAAYPFLASSPDLIVTCECHPDNTRLCEIKCPFSIKGTAPSVDNLPYLHEVDGVVTLKETTVCYGQIQGQLALAGCTECDLFLYTEHGSLTVKVMFNSTFWDKIMAKLIWFWEEKVAPELLKSAASTRNSKKRQNDGTDDQLVPCKQVQCT
jgi:hypothetical protein